MQIRSVIGRCFVMAKTLKLSKYGCQKTISSMFGVGSPPTDYESSVSVKAAASISSNESEKVCEKKSRKFNSKWNTLYSAWLVYVKEDDFMYCKICTDNGKANGMTKNSHCRNFQNSTLTRHLEQKDHKMLVEAPKLRAAMAATTSRISEKQDKAAVALMKSVHWLSSENIPLSKFKSLVSFLHEHETQDMKILQGGKIHFDSPSTANDLLESMSEVVDDDLKEKLKESPFVTALADESTDITNHKRLVVYCQIISHDMEVSTHYVSNLECTDTTGFGIASAILKEFKTRGVEPEKIMSLGSDGASVMTGKEKGAAAIIKRQNPHCVNVHCVAHKLALCTSQAASKITALNTHQQILTELFYYFKASSKRAARVHEIQKLLDDPVLTYKEIHSVRWLSYFDALSAVLLTLDSLLSYLSEAGTKDPKAVGLKKKIGCDKFISITHMMMDAMRPVTVLSQFFQKENVDVSLVKVKLNHCLSDLERVRSMETVYLKQLSLELQMDDDQLNFKGHHVLKTPNFNLQKLVDEFISALTDNITSRFPSDDLLTSFGILSMRPISFLGDDQVEQFGNKELDILCNHYGQEQVVSWKEDGETKIKTSPPLVCSEAAQEEWSMIKRVVLAQQYPRDSIHELWRLLGKYHASEFPNLLKLAQLSLTLAIHTAGCERGFSVQNQTLTPSRNRLSVARQDMLMRVKMGPSRQEFNFPSALSKWKNTKERRLYELKTYK